VVKKIWIYTSTPPYAFMALVKHRDFFTYEENYKYIPYKVK
jgi:hypothetical protein